MRIIDLKILKSYSANFCLAVNLSKALYFLLTGSDVDARTTDGGQTCLHLAARANSTPMCELLLKHGANPSNFASSSGGHSVLHAAARDGALECVQMLLQRGVDPNCRTLVCYLILVFDQLK